MFEQSSLMYPSVFNHPTVRRLACVAWGVILIALCAKIKIPLEPVPITLQTVGVMFIALRFERKTALYTILSYVALGTMGAPVFTHASCGLLYLFGPTGGYCLGFIVCVEVMTRLRSRLDNGHFLAVALNCMLGTVIIYSFGIARLSMLIGFDAAIRSGLLPFIVPGLMKILLLASMLRYLKRAT